MYRDSSDITVEALVYYQAVLDAYRSGRLRVDPGKAIVWFVGKMKQCSFQLSSSPTWIRLH